MEGNDAPVLLDGKDTESGGQLVRSALCLSLVTGRPFHLTHVRTGHESPGLRPRHLAYVRGAEALCSGTSEGASVGSHELRFRPGPVRPGPYVLEMGAGSRASLLLQCLFFPLALAGGGTLTLRGGTHLPKTPMFHYLTEVWLPVVRAYGLKGVLRLRQAGFAPEGAGEMVAEVGGEVEPPVRVELPSRGTLREIAVNSFVGGLPFGVAERQSKAALVALRERGIYSQAENRPLPAARSAGSATFILAQFENTLAGFGAVGERGCSPDEVGREAAEALARFMESGGALDEHLADQMVVPAALLAAGRLGRVEPGTTRYTAERVTEHLRTQARLVERFLPVKAEVEADGGVEIRPA